MAILWSILRVGKQCRRLNTGMVGFERVEWGGGRVEESYETKRSDGLSTCTK